MIGRFCETLEDLCGRAEIFSDDRDEAEWLPLTVSDLKMVINDIVSIRTKKILHLIPVDILSRLLRVLDHQIHRAEGLSIDDCDHVSSCMLRLLFFVKKKKKVAAMKCCHCKCLKVFSIFFVCSL